MTTENTPECIADGCGSGLHSDRCEAYQQGWRDALTRGLAGSGVVEAFLRAHDALRDAQNGQGHPGEKHDHVLGDIIHGEGAEHICDAVADCAACGGAEYGSEDTVHVAMGALRALVGQEPKPWEKREAETVSGFLAATPPAPALTAARLADAFHVATCGCKAGPGEYDRDRSAAILDALATPEEATR